MMTLSQSPQRPDETIADVPDVGADGVRALLGGVSATKVAWARTPALERARLLDECAAQVQGNAQELIGLIVAEIGKPQVEAAGELARSVDILRYHSQQALDPVGEVLPPLAGRGLLFSRSVPRGVATLITPWNFPLAIPLWKSAPALAHGNVVVLKPSPESLGVALQLHEIVNSVLPKNVFTVVPGGAETARALIDAADVVSFTGSEAVGRLVIAHASSRGIPVQAEMSGMNASIVMPDADPASAASMITSSSMGFAGQKCTATSQVILVGNADHVLRATVEAVEALPFGDPALPETLVGPVINERARDFAREATDAAVSAGARVLAGGRRVDEEGWWVQPTLVEGVPPDHPLYQTEVFAPFALVSRAATLAEAVDVVNTSRFGLVTSVFTRDLRHALDGVDSIATGLVRINAPTTFVDLHAPFGGERNSSYGSREQGKRARDFYTTSRTVTVNTG